MFKNEFHGSPSFPMKDEQKTKKQLIAELENLRRHITEQRRIEEDLQQSEVKYRTLAENAQDAIFIISISEGFEYVNPAFERIFGYPSAEVCGKGFSFLSLVHRSDLEFIMKRIEARREGTFGPSFCEFKVITKEGKVRSVETSSVPLPGPGEKIMGRLRDITERKQSEDMLARYQQMLEGSQKELKKFSHQILSIREEERKNLSTILHEEVGSIAIGLSSEFAAIEQEIKDNHLSKALKAVSEGQSMLKKYVARLKKIAAHLRPPDLEIMGLPAALREYFTNIMKTVNIKIDFTSNMGEKSIDDSTAIILYRIIQEAINNIIKHSKAQKVRMTLQSGKQGIKLDIWDDGKGWNIQKKYKNAQEHLGILGMKEMAESLKGTLKITTGSGRGTEISVCLPS